MNWGPPHLRRQGADNVGVTGVQDREDTAPEVLPEGGSELIIITMIVVDTRLGKHRVVLDLGFAQERAVRADDDQLALPLAERLQRALVA